MKRYWERSIRTFEEPNNHVTVTLHDVDGQFGALGDRMLALENRISLVEQERLEVPAVAPQELPSQSVTPAAQQTTKKIAGKAWTKPEGLAVSLTRARLARLSFASGPADLVRSAQGSLTFRRCKAA